MEPTVLNITNAEYRKIMKQIWMTKKYSYTKNPRPDCGLLYLLNGEIDYITKAGPIHLKPNDLIFLPKGSYYKVHFYTDTQPVITYLMNFQTEELANFSKLPTWMLHDKTGFVCNSFRQLYDAFIQAQHPLFIQSLFYQLLYHINLIQKKEKEDVVFETAKKLLTEEQEYTVSEIAEKLFISQSSLQKCFQKHLGQSPVQFRMEKRIEKAKLLLTTTDIPIKDIAISLHFYDISYFYKIFRKYTGITPKTFRGTTNSYI